MLLLAFSATYISSVLHNLIRRVPLSGLLGRELYKFVDCMNTYFCNCINAVLFANDEFGALLSRSVIVSIY